MARRLIETIQGTSGKTAKVFRDTEWDEFVTSFYTNGAKHEFADYHAGSKQDAIQTGRHWTNAAEFEAQQAAKMAAIAAEITDNNL